MPKITYEPWLAFLDENKFSGNEKASKAWREFKPLTKAWLDEKLATIKYRNANKTNQGRALLILGFYSGLRPVEILGLYPNNFDKKGRYLFIKVQAAKRGKSGIIGLPLNDHIKEVWEFAKTKHPELLLFSYFISNNKKVVKWKCPIKVWKDGKIVNGVIDKQKTYLYKSHKIDYFARKHLGLPFYYLRHNRFGEMHQRGTPISEITEAKLGKTDTSTLRYVRFGRTEAKRRSKYYKVD